MAKLYFITHPDVLIDPSIEVTKWGLSKLGRLKLQKMLEQRWIKSIDIIFSSKETKAREAAEILAKHLGKGFNQIKELGEIDRSSTGYLSEEFEKVVDDFFAYPDKSVRGWEKAKDAQRRIVKVVSSTIKQNPNKNIAIVSHGGVGALYLAYLLKKPISCLFNQPGQGHYLCVDIRTNRLVHKWKPIERIE